MRYTVPGSIQRDVELFIREWVYIREWGRKKKTATGHGTRLMKRRVPKRLDASNEANIEAFFQSRCLNFGRPPEVLSHLQFRFTAGETGKQLAGVSSVERTNNATLHTL